ncbi:hypothetical protein MKZ38_009903 [Zalerion maritima]|uniref:Uncharacterized protein n=1 Tax=Zalerion maritima TaxID=339359 RepID=A0AAD5RGL3_9PEZI|nr:hypothetical protein MKZ38_009903 [Zalerion maritima]
MASPSQPKPQPAGSGMSDDGGKVELVYLQSELEQVKASVGMLFEIALPGVKRRGVRSSQWRRLLSDTNRELHCVQKGLDLIKELEKAGKPADDEALGIVRKCLEDGWGFLQGRLLSY